MLKLQEYITYHMSTARDLPVDVRERLLDPVKTYAGNQGWRISARAVANGRAATIRDVLLKDSEPSSAHIVLALVQENGTVYVVADCWARSARKNVSAVFRKVGGVFVHPLRDAFLASCWYFEGGDLVVLC